MATVETPERRKAFATLQELSADQVLELVDAIEQLGSRSESVWRWLGRVDDIAFVSGLTGDQARRGVIALMVYIVEGCAMGGITVAALSDCKDTCPTEHGTWETMLDGELAELCVRTAIAAAASAQLSAADVARLTAALRALGVVEVRRLMHAVLDGDDVTDAIPMPATLAREIAEARVS
jgi:hypothetical protein